MSKKEFFYLYKKIVMSNQLVDRIKQRKKKKLFKKYRFDQWNLLSCLEKVYALDIINYINKWTCTHKNHLTVEIGCGLGDILANINSQNKIGADIEKEAIKADKELYQRKKHSKWINGSFGCIKGKKIDWLITLNFMHAIEPEQLQDYYDSIINRNAIKYIVVDEIYSKGFIYKYRHRFADIFPPSFKKIKQFGPYKAASTKDDVAKRFVSVYKNYELKGK